MGQADGLRARGRAEGEAKTAGQSTGAAATGSGASTVSPARRSKGDQSASSGRLRPAIRAPPAQYEAVSETLSASCPRSGAEGIRTAERTRLVIETTVARWSVGTRLLR